MSFEAINADTKALIEFEKIRFEFAWRHFEFHARQRTTMFHFFILLMPFLFGGFFYFLKSDQFQPANPAAAILVGVIGSVLSVTFLFLDIRNRQLYLVSQNNLKLIENSFLYFYGFRPLFFKDEASVEREFRGIITEEAILYGTPTISNFVLKHKFLMWFIFVTAAILFLTAALYATCIHFKWLGFRI